MKNRLIVLLLILIAFIYYTFISNYSVIERSPNGDKLLKAYSEKNLLVIEVEKAGITEKIMTGTSTVHSWHVSWYDNDKILVRSGDNGDNLWYEITNGWLSHYAYETFSPDGDLSVQVTPDRKNITIIKSIRLLRVNDRHGTSRSVLYQKNFLKIPTKDIFNSIKWVGDNQVFVEGVEITLSNGEWKMTH